MDQKLKSIRYIWCDKINLIHCPTNKCERRNAGVFLGIADPFLSRSKARDWIPTLQYNTLSAQPCHSVRESRDRCVLKVLVYSTLDECWKLVIYVLQVSRSRQKIYYYSLNRQERASVSKLFFSLFLSSSLHTRTHAHLTTIRFLSTRNCNGRLLLNGYLFSTIIYSKYWDNSDLNTDVQFIWLHLNWELKKSLPSKG